MYCKKCGGPVKDGEVTCEACSHSDEIQTEENSFKENNQSDGPDIAGTKNEGNAPKQKNRGGFAEALAKRKKLVIFLSVMLVLVAAIGVFCYWSFPLDVDFEINNSYTTKTGTITNLQFSIETNQPIKDVYYAVAPQKYENLKAYQKISGSGVYSRNVVIPDVKVPAGESKLYICVTTHFGTKAYCEANLFFDLGYVASFDAGMVKELAGGGKFVANEVLVSFNKKVTPEYAESVAKENGGEIAGAIYPLNRYTFKFSNSGEDFIKSTIQKLEQRDDIELASLNMVYQPVMESFPKDSEYDDWTDEKTEADGNNWGLELIGAPKAWDYNSKMQVTKVGVIDGFIYNEHEDLLIDDSKCYYILDKELKTIPALKKYVKKVASTHKCDRDCIEKLCESQYNSHGTHVAGIIGAKANSKGICGVNWNSDIIFASPMHVSKNESNDGLESYSTTDTAMMCIAYCVMSNCRVINMSIEIPETFLSMPDNDIKNFNNLIRDLEKMGYDFLLCKSAGNDHTDAQKNYLVDCLTAGEYSRKHTIVVGSVGNYRRPIASSDEHHVYARAYHSNYGDVVDIMAPGVDIYSTVPDNKYEVMSGTSMATPMVAGAASVIYSLNPNVTYDYVKSLLCKGYNTWCKPMFDSKTYPVLDLGAAVEEAMKNDFNGANADAPRPEIKFGMIEGTAVEAGSDRHIPSVRITCTDSQGRKYTDDGYQGKYQCQLPQGVYDVTIDDRQGAYVPETIYGVEVTNDIVTYNVVLNLVKEKSAKGTAKGTVKDAFDASPVEGALLKVYKGLNCTTGTPVKTLTADLQGQYSLELDAGNYTVCAEAAGYQPGFGNILVLPGKTKADQNCIITPVLNPGEIRVVLTWGANPQDLDSHMVGPAPDGRFHTYFNKMDYIYNGQTYCNLDVDDTTSYGPETTSIYVGTDGTYTFYVHDYTNRDKTYSTSMATSCAEVKVYTAGQTRPKIFSVPGFQGTLWKVFSIKNGIITPINEVSYYSDYSNVGSNVPVN